MKESLRLALLTSAAVFALALTACANGNPTPTLAPGATPTATTAPQPTETATATPPATPTPTRTPAATPTATASAPGAATPTATEQGTPTAETVAIIASKDNTLYESETGADSNGSGWFLFVGKTNGNFTRRTLIAFDIAGAVPSGATIVSADLTLYMSQTSSSPSNVTLQSVGQAWGEGAGCHRRRGAGRASAC